ncbi:unnamed protein product [Linum trigynum]|uniref:Uncharacterized protein n=1 Tax=Linum trigynum TaxID=586398 RepID=A0AAV2GJ97_9ROSI
MFSFYPSPPDLSPGDTPGLCLLDLANGFKPSPNYPSSSPAEEEQSCGVKVFTLFEGARRDREQGRAKGGMRIELREAPIRNATSLAVASSSAPLNQSAKAQYFLLRRGNVGR